LGYTRGCWPCGHARNTQTIHNGSGPWRFEAQLNDNLSIYSTGFETPYPTHLAAAKQHGSPTKLIMQDDDKLVYYAHGGFPTWTRTAPA
jgi:hypothetical protein